MVRDISANMESPEGTKKSKKKPRHYSPAIIDVCENLYYRQSMLKDYATCPQMMLYKWIIGMEEDSTFFSAIMGTAGHEVIRYMHENKDFEITHQDILSIFCEKFDEALDSEKVPPKITSKFGTIKAQRDALAGDYASMLCGYRDDKDNRRFNATMIEQSFVLELMDEFDREFIFTGTIDQAGFYYNGSFALRDIKFRANDFKPGKTELHLDMQLSLYAYAIMHGKPSCRKCSPKYTIDGQVVYNGPCPDCRVKIGTPQWPSSIDPNTGLERVLIPERCEIIWMRDYETHKKDQYAKFIKSDEKVINPKTGRRIKADAINPKWYEGYKKGDRKGTGHLITERSRAFLDVHIADILRQAGMIRDGRFFRKAGNHCNFWCKHRQACMDALEIDVKEIDTSNMNDKMATIDPFSESD